MHSRHRRPLALLGGFGLLTACPTDTPPGGVLTDAAITTSTSSGGEPPVVTGTTTDEPTTSATSGTTTAAPTTGASTTTDAADPSTTTIDIPTTTGDPTDLLCRALGGPSGVADLVAAAVQRILLDDKINAYFLNSDVDTDKFRTCLGKQLGALAGCDGVVYDCLDMKSAHAGLGISGHDFADFVADFALALDAHQDLHPELGDAFKDLILSQLGAFEAGVVEDPAGSQTIYQRVGRKPAIRTMIGVSGEADTFLDNVALNPAINVFFGFADYPRLRTCLTRQIAAIDGPSKYGLEVSAPAPADPGVGLGDPCRSMADTHAGLLDANNLGIDINDFGDLLGELVDAMAAHDVAQADQDAIVAALAGWCEDIVALEWKNACPSAHKLEVVEHGGLAAAIPDSIYDGNPPSMLCRDLVVPDDPIAFVDDVEVRVGIDHVWVGDLTIKLISPEGKTLTLLSRPGLDEQVDDGTDCCGDSADLSKAFPLTFRDGGLADAEQIGASLPNPSQVVCKDDMMDPCEWVPNPGAGPGGTLADFRGDLAAGTWKLCVGDSNLSDKGSLDAVALTIARVKYDPMP